MGIGACSYTSYVVYRRHAIKPNAQNCNKPDLADAYDSQQAQHSRQLHMLNYLHDNRGLRYSGPSLGTCEKYVLNNSTMSMDPIEDLYLHTGAALGLKEGI